MCLQILNFLKVKYISFALADDNIDETYGVNVQFESDEEASSFSWFILRSLLLVMAFVL